MPTKEPKVITISFQKAMAIVAGAILTSIVGTVFTTASVLNSDHFAIINNTEAIGELKVNCVTKDKYELQVEVFNKKMDEMNNGLKEIMNYLKE